MSEPLINCEGNFVDSYNNLIRTVFVDLRAPRDRAPIATLVKGCHQEYALECCHTIRISKPALFREFGEGLIRDSGEMHFSRTLADYEVIDDPDNLARARLRDDELNRAADLLQTGIRSTTKSVKQSFKSSRGQKFGKNGWIYCASIKPNSEQEMAKWRKTLPKEYNHVSYIHRPREFAMALGSMVTEECGPRGNEAPMTFSFGKLSKVETTHLSQTIFHGPVVYVEDPYAKIVGDGSNGFRFLWSLFLKSTKYQDQMEYRFAIHAEEEPFETYVDLRASPAMLGSLQEPSTNTKPLCVSTEVSPKEPCKDAAPLTESGCGVSAEEEKALTGTPSECRLNTSLLDDVSKPSTRVVPYPYSAEELPPNWQEIAGTYSFMSNLRRRVEGLPEERRMQVASAAWYAEPYVRGLCSRYEDPIEAYFIDVSNLVVVNLKLPGNGKPVARIAVGPQGTCTYVVWSRNGKVSSRGNATWPVSEWFWEHLEEAGFRRRIDSAVLDHRSAPPQAR